MDIATLVGTVSGTVLVLIAIFLGGGVGMFFNVPSIMITVGGMGAATLINYPLEKVMGVFAIAKKTVFHKPISPQTEIARMVEYTRIARKDGLLALEAQLGSVEDPFLAKGVQLVIDGVPQETVRDVLTIEMESLQERHNMGKGILESMGAAAPAFGMIGTLIGLVQMLRQLEDPSQIGVGMSTALLTTFYGALMANLILLPLAGKLGARSKEEVLLKGIMIEGISAIQSGDNPRMVEDKLKAFVAPGQRVGLETPDE